ncbi:VirB4 family type IV secretion system protein [Azohydromonas australica]|uniref:VirB4 family type IV secretion/conjugal transfer ATPase n=1 Tax=Azohydromonas australica TaxID=364039 RepID=UPI0004105549|nr:VirB4 family type IV secretion system protein [Azohydromonas australica]
MWFKFPWMAPWLTRFVPPASVAAARMLPLGHILRADTVKTRRGTYLRAWRLEGVCWESASPDKIAEYHEAICSFLSSLPGGHWRVSRYLDQRYTSGRLTPLPGDSFGAKLERTLARLDQTKPYLETCLITVLEYIPQRVLDGLGDPRTLEQVGQDDAQGMRELDEHGLVLERSLRQFRPAVLGEYERKGRRYSHFAETLAYFATGLRLRVRADAGPLFLALSGAARTSFKEGAVEISGPLGKRWAVMLGINEYKDAFPGILSALMFERVELLQTQVWWPMLRRDSIEALQKQQNYLKATEDVSVEQGRALLQAMEAVQDGIINMGHYGYVLSVFGATLEEAEANASRIAAAVMQTSGIQLARVDLLADNAWYFQVPGNFNKRPRIAELSSRAVAALAPDHDTLHGKRWGHAWGEAWIQNRTTSNRKYPWSPHASHPRRNVAGRPVAGSICMTGMTGGGKSLLLNLINAQSERYDPRPRILLWDMDRSNEIFARASGFDYRRIRVGEATGINPFQRPRNKAIRPRHLLRWAAIVQECLVAQSDAKLTDAEYRQIATAVKAVATLPWQKRGLSAVRQMLLAKGPDGEGSSLHERLAPWCRGEELGWVLDGEDRLPDASDADRIAFDFTEFLNSKRICGPLVAALTDYSTEMIDGRRIIVACEEAWKPLDNERLAAMFEKFQLTVRKLHGLCINVTQQPTAFMNSRAGQTMVNQAATFIALADEQSTFDVYGRMGYSAEDVDIIRTLREGGVYRFLLRQPAVGPSIVLEHDLTGIEPIDGVDPIVILSGEPEHVELLDEIRDRVGDNPKDWMPLLGQAVRDLKARQTGAR